MTILAAGPTRASGGRRTGGLVVSCLLAVGSAACSGGGTPTAPTAAATPTPEPTPTPTTPAPTPGLSYRSPDQEQEPAQPISRIEGPPVSPGGLVTPVGTFRFARLDASS